jgi:hypothetical protein
MITEDAAAISRIPESVKSLRLRGVRKKEKRRLLNVHEKLINKVQFL